ncbi:MAG: hypothetical protein ACI808_001661 [Paraglaciecola sp.]|jgi:hypothetical protein
MIIGKHTVMVLQLRAVTNDINPGAVDFDGIIEKRFNNCLENVGSAYSLKLTLTIGSIVPY